MELKDISGRFSLQDFFAYLFPGITAALGIYVLLLITPLKDFLLSIEFNFIVGFLAMVLSYIIGALLSGFSWSVTSLIKKLFKLKLDEPRESIPIPELKKDIIEAFNDLFKVNIKTDSEWAKSHFYLCRTLVHELMPNAAKVADRQNSLRLFRLYIIPSILIWTIAGITWGVWNIVVFKSITWGIVLIVASIVLAIRVISLLIIRMHGNQKREVREIFTAFLVGYRLGIFSTCNVKQEE